jgi:hypothetical protein
MKLRRELLNCHWEGNRIMDLRCCLVFVVEATNLVFQEGKEIRAVYVLTKRRRNIFQTMAFLCLNIQALEPI